MLMIHLYRLNDNHGLEEGQQERRQPFVSFRGSPFHTVEDGEESWRNDTEETHCKRKSGFIIWVASSENVPVSMRKMCEFIPFCISAKTF